MAIIRLFVSMTTLSILPIGLFILCTLMQGAEALNSCIGQNTVLPQLVYLLFCLLSKEVGNSLLQIAYGFWGVEDGHHPQQFKLCII